MAPTKTVMGTSMHVPTDPPHEDGPPNVQPPERPRSKMASKPRVEEAWEQEGPTSAATPQARKLSPPGGFKLEGPGGWRLSVPGAVLVAVLAGGGGAGIATKVAGGEGAVADELRGLRDDVATLRKEVREVRDEQRSLRADNRAVLSYTRESVTLLAQTMRELGAKVETATGPLPPLEMHPAPLRGSAAPRVQPRATLPDPPELGP